MFSQKSVLARLLANENIVVQRGNYDTAYFDVEKRVLGLPLWKEMSKDVYDMLVGHEVSHALFTPRNFFEYEGSAGIPHSWLNIVEDIRIEKLILRKYPGLVGNFKRGYSEMMMGPSDLFGIRERDISTMGFMDRLNIRAKARDMIAVPFADDEALYVAKAMAVETYEDVIRVCQEIRAWLKEKAETEKQNGDDTSDVETPENTITIGIITDESEKSEGEGETVTPDIIIDARTKKSEREEESEEEAETETSGSGDEKSEEEGQDGEGKDDAEEEGKSEASKSESASEPKSGSADQEVETEVAYQQNQSSMVDTSTTYVRGLSRKESMDRILPYSVVATGRRDKTTNSWTGNKRQFPEAAFAEFVRESKMVVNLMVKEFEMRKAAYRSLRARESTKGSLDVNKLHKYQYDDMLFKQVSTLADAKNHGMVMLIDYSGSMCQMLPNVIRQTLTLLMFCKRVGIPFEVYSFTSINDVWRPYVKDVRDKSVTYVASEGLGLIKLFSTDMSKSDYEESFRMMFWQSVDNSVRSQFEDLRSTPLNTALMAMQYVIEDFRAKYRVQKMNFIALTDGVSTPLHFYGGDDTRNQTTRRGSGYSINVNGKIIKVDSRYNYGAAGRAVTASLVKAIRDMGVTCVNYFVCSSSSEVSREICRSLDTDHIKPSDAARAARKKLLTDGVLVLDDNYGYNRRFILDGRGKEMSGKIDDLDFDADASVAKISKAFSKVSGSKKKSKIVTQKFAEMVA